MVGSILRSSASASKVFCRTTRAARLPRTEEEEEDVAFASSSLRIADRSIVSSSFLSFFSAASMFAALADEAPLTCNGGASPPPLLKLLSSFATTSEPTVKVRFLINTTFNFAFVGKFKCRKGQSMSTFTPPEEEEEPFPRDWSSERNSNASTFMLLSDIIPSLLAHSSKQSLNGFIGGKDLRVIFDLPSSERTVMVVAMM